MVGAGAVVCAQPATNATSAIAGSAPHTNLVTSPCFLTLISSILGICLMRVRARQDCSLADEALQETPEPAQGLQIPVPRTIERLARRQCRCTAFQSGRAHNNRSSVRGRTRWDGCGPVQTV